MALRQPGERGRLVKGRSEDQGVRNGVPHSPERPRPVPGIAMHPDSRFRQCNRFGKLATVVLAKLFSLVAVATLRAIKNVDPIERIAGRTVPSFDRVNKLNERSLPKIRDEGRCASKIWAGLVLHEAPIS